MFSDLRAHIQTSGVIKRKPFFRITAHNLRSIQTTVKSSCLTSSRSLSSSWLRNHNDTHFLVLRYGGGKWRIVLSWAGELSGESAIGVGPFAKEDTKNLSVYLRRQTRRAVSKEPETLEESFKLVTVVFRTDAPGFKSSSTTADRGFQTDSGFKFRILRPFGSESVQAPGQLST